MRKLYNFILFFLVVLTSAAQDPQFSQYFSAPLYLNPAFTGTTQSHRFISNYRNQWPSIGNGFVTYAVSYDADLYAYNSGVGILATMDQAGSAGLKSSQVNLLYSYKWNVSNKWVVSAGLNFGYAFRSIDFNKLVFSDQLLFDSQGNLPSDDPILFDLSSAHYFDFNSGMLAYNKNFWFGFSVSHLNRPNNSLIDQEALIPIKTSIHGGAQIPLNNGPMKRENNAILAPSFVYKQQGNFDQLDVGVSLLYQPVVLGLWYRGIPIQQNVKDNISQDAVVVILGFRFEKFEVAYSYDITVSELGPASGGSHEISMQYRLPKLHKSKPVRRERYIPCPTFYDK
jgi:type IX secretion system PorP/SprF family membrane protein